MARQEYWLTDAKGKRLLNLSYVLKATCSRSLSAIGRMNILMPATFPQRYLKRDYQIQVWRNPPGGKRYLWNAYFIRRWRIYRSGRRGSPRYIEIWGHDGVGMLERRIVLCYAGLDESSKTAPADDMMKEIVREAGGGTTGSFRNALDLLYGESGYYALNVDPDHSQATSIAKGFAWQKLLEASGTKVLTGIAQTAKAINNEDIYFTVQAFATSSASTQYTFRTGVGYLGQDLSGKQTFSESRGNLAEGVWEFDAENEITYAVAGGKGQGIARLLHSRYDEQRFHASPWNRCEAFKDMTTASLNELPQISAELLESGRPVESIGGTILDTPYCRLGVEYRIGDKVSAVVEGRYYEPIISDVVLKLDSGAEQRIIQLEYTGATVSEVPT